MKKILLVDDDEVQHILVEALLKHLPSQPDLVSFFTVEAALQALEQKISPPDLILLDLSMPGLNGFDFLARFATLLPDYPQTQLYILSSSSLVHDREKALVYPFVKGYLLKPLLMVQLQALLQEMSAARVDATSF